MVQNLFEAWMMATNFLIMTSALGSFLVSLGQNVPQKTATTKQPRQLKPAMSFSE